MSYDTKYIRKPLGIFKTARCHISSPSRTTLIDMFARENLILIEWGQKLKFQQNFRANDTLMSWLKTCTFHVANVLFID